MCEELKTEIFVDFLYVVFVLSEKKYFLSSRPAVTVPPEKKLRFKIVYPKYEMEGYDFNIMKGLKLLHCFVPMCKCYYVGVVRTFQLICDSIPSG